MRTSGRSATPKDGRLRASAIRAFRSPWFLSRRSGLNVPRAMTLPSAIKRRPRAKTSRRAPGPLSRMSQVGIVPRPDLSLAGELIEGGGVGREQPGRVLHSRMSAAGGATGRSGRGPAAWRWSVRPAFRGGRKPGKLPLLSELTVRRSSGTPRSRKRRDGFLDAHLRVSRLGLRPGREVDEPTRQGPPDRLLEELGIPVDVGRDDLGRRDLGLAA